VAFSAFASTVDSVDALGWMQGRAAAMVVVASRDWDLDGEGVEGDSDVVQVEWRFLTCPAQPFPSAGVVVKAGREHTQSHDSRSPFTFPTRSYAVL
jgi:hypothetical protein